MALVLRSEYLATMRAAVLEGMTTRRRAAALRSVFVALSARLAAEEMYEDYVRSGLPPSDAAALARWRHEHGMTQVRLAAALGLSVAVLRDWEQARFPPPVYLPLALAALDEGFWLSRDDPEPTP